MDDPAPRGRQRLAGSSRANLIGTVVGYAIGIAVLVVGLVRIVHASPPGWPLWVASAAAVAVLCVLAVSTFFRRLASRQPRPSRRLSKPANAAVLTLVVLVALALLGYVHWLGAQVWGEVFPGWTIGGSARPSAFLDAQIAFVITLMAAGAIRRVAATLTGSRAPAGTGRHVR
jgi:lysylphosphatidylglycerol synthetase-like protein (DUF2156 family)